jgi:hypothetical protein
VHVEAKRGAKSRTLGPRLVPHCPRRSVIRQRNQLGHRDLAADFGAGRGEWFDRRASNAEEKSSALPDPTPRGLVDFEHTVY